MEDPFFMKNIEGSKVKIELNRKNDAFHFQGKGIGNVTINIDGSPEIGGENAGARPMELILMGLGSCSAIDIIQILKKQKQEISEIKINIEAERENKIPAVFKNINIEYYLSGELDKNKVDRAIRLSMDKYCSVTAMLNKTAKINYSFKIN